MIIAVSHSGISVTYRCVTTKYGWFRLKKCPDQSREKCIRCKYCVAEMPAADATKLLNVYDKYRSQAYGSDEQSGKDTGKTSKWML